MTMLGSWKANRKMLHSMPAVKLTAAVQMSLTKAVSRLLSCDCELMSCSAVSQKVCRLPKTCSYTRLLCDPECLSHARHQRTRIAFGRFL